MYTVSVWVIGCLLVRSGIIFIPHVSSIRIVPPVGRLFMQAMEAISWMVHWWLCISSLVSDLNIAPRNQGFVWWYFILGRIGGEGLFTYTAIIAYYIPIWSYYIPPKKTIIAYNINPLIPKFGGRSLPLYEYDTIVITIPQKYCITAMGSIHFGCSFWFLAKAPKGALSGPNTRQPWACSAAFVHEEWDLSEPTKLVKRGAWQVTLSSGVIKHGWQIHKLVWENL